MQLASIDYHHALHLLRVLSKDNIQNRNSYNQGQPILSNRMGDYKELALTLLRRKSSLNLISEKEFHDFLMPFINSLMIGLGSLGVTMTLRQVVICRLLVAQKLVEVSRLPSKSERLSFLSEFAARLREYAITGSFVGDLLCRKLVFGLGRGLTVSSRLDVFFQISCFKRALPLPDQAKVKQSMDKFVEITSKEFTTDPVHLTSIRRFCLNWGKTFAGKFNGDMQFRPPSGATYRSTRKSGGGSEEIRGVLNSWLNKQIDFQEYKLLLQYSNYSFIGFRLYDESIEEFEGYRPRLVLLKRTLTSREAEVFSVGPGVPDVNSFLEEVYRTEACLDDLTSLVSGVRLPKMAYASVKENGGKVRSLAKSEASFIYLLHGVGTSLRDLLKHEISTRGAVSGQPFESWLTILRKWKAKLREPTTRSCLRDESAFVFRSADLTQATDLMPRDLLQSIVSGLVEGLGINMGKGQESLFGKLLFASIGDYQMDLPDGTTFITKRGVSMGLPTSWFLLNIYNLWLVETSWYDVLGIRGFGSHRVARSHAQCGDDLVAYWPSVVNERYTVLLEQTGGAPSAGKDLTDKQCFNFVEKAGLLSGTKIRAPNVIPLRAVCGSSSSSGIPDYIEAGASISSVMSQLPYGSARRVIVSRIVGVSHSLLIKRLHKMGLNPYVERKFGGGGFPILESEIAGWRCYPGFCRAWRIALSHLRGFDSLRRSIGLTSPWSSLSDQIRVNVWDQVRAHVDEYGMAFKAKEEDGVFLGDQVEGAVARLQFLSTGSLVQNSIYPSLHTVSGGMHKVVERLNRIVPKHKLSDNVNNLTLGILRKFGELRKEFCYVPNFVSMGLSSSLVVSVHSKVGFKERRDVITSMVSVNDIASKTTVALLSREGARRNLDELVEAEEDHIW